MTLFERDFKTLLEEVRAINTDTSHSTPLKWDITWQPVMSALEGWVSGIVVVSGQSNHGKSSITMNLLRQIVTSNEDRFYVLDFTLDDTARKRVCKYIALSRMLRINDVLLEASVSDQDVVNQISLGYKELEGWNDRYRMFDQHELSMFGSSQRIACTVEAVKRVVFDFANYMKRKGDARTIFVCIDGINDLVTEERFPSEIQQEEAIVRHLLSLATDLACPVLVTSRSRKVTNWKNPSMDDIFSGTALKYAAEVVTFTYNDSKLRSSIIQSPMRIAHPVPTYYAHLDNIVPVLVWHFKKNKVSNFNERLYLKFVDWSNYVEPLPADQSSVFEGHFQEMN